MNSFSIAPYEHQSILDTYKQWLVSDLYQNFYFDSLNDPNFLQKLSILQAEGIRHDIGLNTVVTHNSIQEAGSQVGRKIQSAANLITSSLDDGFMLMNQRMVEVNNNLGAIGQGIDTVNSTLQQGNHILSDIDKGIVQTNRGIAQMNRGINAMASAINTLNSNMIAGMSQLDKNMVAGLSAINDNISQCATMLQYQLQQIEYVLQAILNELRIPESQRERRYHIEEGMKYFNKGMKSGDCLYFEDALDEFTTATSIERKDFFSWYYIGMIHLYSKDHIDFDKALSAFDRYIHYADALPQRHNLFNEALMMKAECYYLKQDLGQAYQTVERIVPTNVKAALRAMKYLSASGVVDKQCQAVEILKQLIEKNPYIVMQVLEDFDLVSNKYILQYIKDYKKEITEEIKRNKALSEKSIKTLTTWPRIFDEFNTELTTLNSNILKSTFGIIDFVKINDSYIGLIRRIEHFHNDAETAKWYSNSKWGMRTNSGYTIIPFQYESFHSMFDDMFAVLDSNLKWGIINKRGCVISPCQWKKIDSFYYGPARVEDFSGKYGLIDKTGHMVTPCQWKSIGDFNEGLVAVEDSAGEWGYVDKTGRLVISCQWQYTFRFSEGLAAVEDSAREWGYVDKTGRLVIPCQWQFAHDFHEGLASVKDSKSQFGFINKMGHLAIHCRWKEANGFFEGLAAVKDYNDQYGFINNMGNLVIPCRWKKTWAFHEGLAAVEDSSGKWGYVDKIGRLVVQCQWKSAGLFFEGRARVEDFDGKSYKIDKTGKKYYD